ncbi:hypothetical protein [Rhizobium sp. LC145]|uniref:hypothetical protein n=1 Tax=Rhizobium sp. LC145 TaxID=1120688 RepID=UPI00062A1F47|nr:hypothetical protein [Rhizobium sp. LC145]KKX23867.1 hypothetical protein YH62_28500 [Rhizobium sp. LC145]TKT67087.1 hypothetical protein FDR95_03370 [Rhizobiaceae bacterium LC148]
MSIEEYDTDTQDVSVAEAKRELTRLLSDGRFHATDRQKAILVYLAERKFAGCEAGTKAFAIAVDVLGRTSSFDSAVDPIVRIEIGRLRSSLENYYEAYGQSPGTRIEVPRGRYVSIFTRKGFEKGSFSTTRDDTAHKQDNRPTDDIAPYTASKSAVRRPWRVLPTIVLALCLSAGVVAAAWMYSRPPVTDPPIVFISVDAGDPEYHDEASLAEEILLATLTRFRNLTVVTEPPSATPSTVTYRLKVAFQATMTNGSMRWQFIDMRSGHHLAAGVETTEILENDRGAARLDLASALAGKLAAARGIINHFELRAAPDHALGNICVLRAEGALDDGDLHEIDRASECLEKTLALNPKHADAAAALAGILAMSSDEHSIGRAIGLAKEALAADPRSDRAHISLARALAARGEVARALTSANRARSLNPYNPDVTAALATILFAAGSWDAAVGMATEAGRIPDVVPGEVVLVQALDAYRRRNWIEATSQADRLHAGEVGSMLKVAAHGQLASPQLARRLLDLRREFPDFESAFRARIAVLRLDPSLVDSIEDGLRKAGAALKMPSKADAQKSRQ